MVDELIQLALCPVCGKENIQRVIVGREMMFGYREQFRYVECSHCKSLSNLDVPKDLSRYYPSDYLSLQAREDGALKRILKRARFMHVWGKESKVGGLLVSLFGTPRIANWLQPTGVNLNSSILDVGCGKGFLLRQLHNVGFRNLVGIDPFLERGLDISDGLCLRKCNLAEVDGRQFDLILFHHSLEHTSDLEGALAAARRLLANGGYVVVSIPVAASYACRCYGADWAQLDAPRHLVIPSAAGMKTLATRAGFAVTRIEYDSDGFQFWGSELVAADVPLMSDRAFNPRARRSRFKKADLLKFSSRAAELNRCSDGDQATFYLQLA